MLAINKRHVTILTTLAASMVASIKLMSVCLSLSPPVSQRQQQQQQQLDNISGA